jgi:MioC protein
VNDEVTILVGSMSGNADLVAEAVESALSDAGVAARIRGLDEIALADFEHGPCIVCTSTYGTGEVPDNAKGIYAMLCQERPALGGLLYGVFGLGDSIYPDTFCFGGKRFDTVLSDLGAERIGARVDHDSRSRVKPDVVAREWAAAWSELLKKRLST